MLGAIISAGASLIGGMLGKSDAEKRAKAEKRAIEEANRVATENANRMNREVRARADAAALVPVQSERESVSQGSVDMDKFLADAEKAGFNPLTYLRSGALSMYAHQEMADWTCTTGERAMDAAVQGQYIPQLSPVMSQTQVPGYGEILGNALTTGVNQYLNDAQIKENNAFQMALLDRQLQGAQSAGSYSGSRSGYVPSAFLHGSVAKGGGGELIKTNGGQTTLNLKNMPVITLPDGPKGADVCQAALGEVCDWLLPGSALIENTKQVLGGDSWTNKNLVRPAVSAIRRGQQMKPTVNPKGFAGALQYIIPDEWKYPDGSFRWN